jgi:protein-S-isoprenylcysteine O-methyltransferase Ste14
MIVFDQRALGIAILFLLGMLVTVKRLATGSVLDKPKGSFLPQLVNFFNLFFLLVVNPLAAILLIARRLPTIELAPMDKLWFFIVIEIVGLAIYVSGFLLMAWALVTLGGNYQLGGSAPRSEDKMVIDGPYRLVRHPMYTAALSISLGLACLLHVWVLVCVFCTYVLLVMLLIPAEEQELQKAYSEEYGAYQRKTRGLIPFVY